MKKKVLIITYYWPPAGGPGVQRWLKFVKYLREYGVEPVVYIPENPSYPLQDTTFTADVPPDIKIYKHPIVEPYAWANFLSKKKTKRISSGIIQSKNQSFLERVMLWIRGNFFIPDARKFWVKPSISFLQNVLNKEKIDTVITTGPPHSVHLIGLGLKDSVGVQWLADFRDPWTSIGYHKKLKLSAKAKAKHKKLEALVLQNADKILVTSKATKVEFSGITKQPIKVITNGYDEAYSGEENLDKAFTISHIGSLLEGRNPSNLWEVLADLVSENKAFASSFCLQLIGVVSNDVMASLEKYNLQDYVKVLGYVPHDKAIQFQRRSQVLLLTEINSKETEAILPGKLFEYINAERPILAIGPQKWEVASILEETTAGQTFTYSEKSELKALLLKWFNAFENQNLSIQPKHKEKYSRKMLTKELAAYIVDGHRI